MQPLRAEGIAFRCFLGKTQWVIWNGSGLKLVNIVAPLIMSKICPAPRHYVLPHRCLTPSPRRRVFGPSRVPTCAHCSLAPAGCWCHALVLSVQQICCCSAWNNAFPLADSRPSVSQRRGGLARAGGRLTCSDPGSRRLCPSPRCRLSAPFRTQ